MEMRMLWAYVGFYEKSREPVSGVTDHLDAGRPGVDQAVAWCKKRGILIQTLKPISNDRGLSDLALAEWWLENAAPPLRACNLDGKRVPPGVPRRIVNNWLMLIIMGHCGDIIRIRRHEEGHGVVESVEPRRQYAYTLPKKDWGAVFDFLATISDSDGEIREVISEVEFTFAVTRQDQSFCLALVSTASGR